MSKHLEVIEKETIDLDTTNISSDKMTREGVLTGVEQNNFEVDNAPTIQFISSQLIPPFLIEFLYMKKFGLK